MLFIKIIIAVFLSIQFSSICFADIGNTSIESFSKSKKILRKIHKKNPITFYCQCRYVSNKPNWKSCGYTPKKDKKRASRIEWEHVLPASHFGIKFDTWKKGHSKCVNKKGKTYKGRKCTEKIYSKYRKMQADLYNLQPAVGEVNGLRSNYQIALINGEKREFGKCDVEIKNKKFEPSENVRGNIARIYMYMELSYPKYIRFDKNIKEMIIAWDKDDPVDAWECSRAKTIEQYQGNTNNILKVRCNQNITNTKQSNKKQNDDSKTKVSKKISDNKLTTHKNDAQNQISKKISDRTNNLDNTKLKSTIGSFSGKGITKDALK